MVLSSSLCATSPLFQESRGSGNGQDPRSWDLRYFPVSFQKISFKENGQGTPQSSPLLKNKKK